MIQRPSSGEWPLGIPNTGPRCADRRETGAGADLRSGSGSGRVWLSAERAGGDAIQTVLVLLRRGHTDVVDADLSKYFDTIPHHERMHSIAASSMRIRGRAPQGGVISPRVQASPLASAVT